ncbi:MAG: putative phage abortive infection protein [Bacteroidia bacterium]|nr:putative phage abortive infection protein [Bacteroidia bacterium]
MKNFADDNIDFQKIISQEKLLNKDIAKIGRSISVFAKLAWVLIIIGLLAGIFALADKLALKQFSEISGLMGWVILALWILAGFLFLFIAFLSQKQQIQMNHIETKFNEIELKTTSIEHEVLKHRFNELHDSIKQERFEGTFFQLLSVHNVIVNSLDIIRITDNDTQIAKGRDCFSTLFQQFLQKARFVYDLNLEKILQHYDEFYSENHADLGHYLGNLYHIIKFVDTSDIEDKGKYINFVRAQLSSYELALLFYNALSKQGRENFKPLIEKYSILKNIPKSLIIDPSHTKQFDGQAFK